MRHTITALLVLLSTVVFCQDLHTPAQLLEILDKSTLTYSIDVFKEEIKPPDRSEKLNLNDIFVDIDTAGNIETYKYALTDEARSLYDQAEAYFEKGDIDKARDGYLKVILKQPGFYKALTYIGQTYGIQQDFANAEKYYRMAIEKNYIDYMAHWFLADIYFKNKDYKNAAFEITLAQVLNRNNPRIKAKLDEIYKKARLDNPDWTFTPQIRIQEGEENQIMIQTTEDWMGYALGKAVWMFEPGYAEKMGKKSENSLSSTEEKECILGLFTAADNNKKLRKQPFMKALQKALDEHMINEFIFYEIFLPDHPGVAYNLPKDFLTDIANYVIKVRGN